MNQQIPATSASRKPAPPACGSRRPQHGFTLIELLVVIGIILLLMGLLYAGIKIVTAQAKEKDTRTMLETCKTMFENYRNATHLTRPPMIIQAPRAPTSLTWCNLSRNGAAAQEFWTLAQVDAPDSAHMPGTSPYLLPNPITMDPAWFDTICVMYTMESIPENQTILNNIPANKILHVTFTSTAGAAVSIPLILDGWGNPILFVPGGGLGMNNPNASNASSPFSIPGVVCLDGANYGIVNSIGVISNITTSPKLSTYNAANPPVGVIAAYQPFFASAGPDGDFSNAHGRTVAPNTTLPNPDMTDDNVYSFK